MCDLATILPHYNPPGRLLRKFEAQSLTVADLLALDATELSRRCPTASLLEVKRFLAALTAALAGDTPGEGASQLNARETLLTTGDGGIDRLLGGGVRAGGIVEFVGESGAGKTQFLLTLALTAQLPRALGGLGRSAVYISTEAPLSTPRLVQLAGAINRRLAVGATTTTTTTTTTAAAAVTTDRVLAITCNDLEAQEHILRYQLPVAVARHDVGLVVVDSIAANFRAELDRPDVRKRVKTTTTAAAAAAAETSGPALLARRGAELVAVAQDLRELARRHNLVVVVANQVSDRFAHELPDDVYSLDYQSRWFTGWPDAADALGAKVPALGLVWANRLAARFVLRRTEDGSGRIRRRIGVVFAGWAKAGEELEFEIWEGGVRSVEEKQGNQDAGPSIYA